MPVNNSKLPVNPLTGIETNRFTVYSFLFIVDGLVVCGSLAEWWASWLVDCLLGWGDVSPRNPNKSKSKSKCSMPGGVLDRADFDGHADVISDPLRNNIPLRCESC